MLTYLERENRELRRELHATVKLLTRKKSPTLQELQLLVERIRKAVPELQAS
jgi:hypothetical protein